MLVESVLLPWLQRRPRRVRRRSGTWGELLFVRLFTLPHILVGLGLLLSVPLTFATVYLGQVHQGRIVSKWTTTGKNRIYYQVKYEYEVGGAIHSDERACSEPQFNQMGNFSTTEPVQPIEVRTLKFLGSESHEAYLPGESHFGPVWNIALPALLWNAFMCIFFWFFYITPWRMKRLVRWGEPVTGRIYQKRIGGRGRYFLKCAFIHPGIGSRQVEVEVQGLMYNRATEYEAVTMLCYPNRKRPVTVYEYGDFECL